MEEASEAWEKPRNRKRKHNNSYKKGQALNKHHCNKCGFNFISEEKLTDHALTHKSVTTKISSKMSEKVFNNEMLLKEHPLDHTEGKSKNCDEVMGTLDKQAETHRESQEVTNEIKVAKVQEHKSTKVKMDLSVTNVTESTLI